MLKFDGEKRENQAFLLAEEFILNNLGEETLSLTKIAEELECSKKHVIAIFRQNGKITPLKFIRALRLKIATELMENRHFSLTDIAYECGFGSYENFYRVFKFAKGNSPSQFRRGIVEKSEDRRLFESP